MLEAAGSSETVYFYQTTLRHIREDTNLQELQWKNLLHEHTLPITRINNQGDLVTVKNLGSNSYHTTFVPMRDTAARGQQGTKFTFFSCNSKRHLPASS